MNVQMDLFKNDIPEDWIQVTVPLHKGDLCSTIINKMIVEINAIDWCRIEKARMEKCGRKAEVVEDGNQIILYANKPEGYKDLTWEDIYE